MKKVWLSWSTGKDCAWTLHTLRMEGKYEVTGLFTTVTEQFSRVSMHGVRIDLLEAQADRVGLPVHIAKIPYPCSNKLYERAMEDVWEAAINSGIQIIAFGDLFLEDVRQYRIDLLKCTGLDPIFPLWGKPTRELAESMVSSGLRATLTCVDPTQMAVDSAGKFFDSEFLEDLPSTVDPCGENGEFHTFVHAGPMFSAPIDVTTGDVVKRNGFIFADVILCNEDGENAA